jgi:hypothetical protein
MITNFLKLIKIRKRRWQFPEDEPKNVETCCSCGNCKITYNNIVHFVCYIIYKFQLNYSNIAVHWNTTKLAQHFKCLPHISIELNHPLGANCYLHTKCSLTHTAIYVCNMKLVLPKLMSS